MRYRLGVSAFIACLVVLLSSASAWAVPISLSVLLTGDPRPHNPDDLLVRVSILGDASNENITYWTVDLLMDSTHPNARLDEFGFSLVPPGSQYTFSNISPSYSWSSLDRLQGYGSGNAKFLFTLEDPAGNANDANNLRSLTFTLTKSSAFTLADLASAPMVCSNDTLLGCNQLAAHLVGLQGGASGIAAGDYGDTPTNSVPEPSSMALLGSGALAAVIARRRNSRG